MAENRGSQQQPSYHNSKWYRNHPNVQRPAANIPQPKLPARKEKWTKTHEIIICVVLPILIGWVVEQLTPLPIWALFLIGLIPLGALLHLLLPSIPTRVMKGTLVVIVMILYAFCEMWTQKFHNRIEGDKKMDDVFNHLTASVSVPQNNPFDSKFSVRNGGSADIGFKRIACKPVLFVTGGNATRYNGQVREEFPSGGVRLPAGTADANDCLAILRVDTPTLPECMDVLVGISFSIDGWPDVFRYKEFRLMGTPSLGVFEWTEKSDQSVEGYCESYVRTHPTPMPLLKKSAQSHSAKLPLCDPTKAAVTACNVGDLDAEDIYAMNSGQGVNAQNIPGKVKTKNIVVIGLPEPLNSMYIRGRDLAFACETLQKGLPIWPQAHVKNGSDLRAEIIKWKDNMTLVLTEEYRSQWVSTFGWYPDPATDTLDSYCSKMSPNGPMLNFMRAMELEMAKPKSPSSPQ